MIRRRPIGSQPADEQTVNIDRLEGKTIMGIDPGTNVLGYGIIRIENHTPRSVVLGVVNMGKFGDRYQKLRHIFERITALVTQYKPDEVALEAPFFGDNVQSMLKLGRAQGVAMTAALMHDIPVFEYAPTRIKQAITGQGSASKEQVSALLQKILCIDDPPRELDATDATAVALCHYYVSSGPVSQADPYTQRRSKSSTNWSSYVEQNPTKIKQ